jgi:hypothetical protein
MRESQWSWRSSSTICKYASLSASILLIGLILLLARGPSPNEEIVVLDEATKLNSCRTNSIGLLKPERIDIILLTQLSDFCYNQVRGEDLLGDFHVRKLNFIQQEYDSRILLWMVVAITISGVVLAALQLLAGYRLASVAGVDFASGQGGEVKAGVDFASAQGGEVKFDPKSVSLKSSVTGLLILIISFAFFIVYVKWVYPIQTRMDPEADPSVGRPLLIFKPGGPGAPPQQAPNEIKAPASSTGSDR